MLNSKDVLHGGLCPELNLNITQNGNIEYFNRVVYSVLTQHQ